MKRDENGDYYDRDGKWSTSTAVMCLLMGFCMGFLACHEIYTGSTRLNDIGIQLQK